MPRRFKPLIWIVLFLWGLLLPVGALSAAGTGPRSQPTDSTTIASPAPSLAQATAIAESDAAFNAGLAAFNANDFEAALGHWQRAVALYQAAGRDRDVANTQTAIMAAALRLGRYGDAIRHGQAALELATTLADAGLQVRILGNLGIAYQESGRYADAIATYEQALTVVSTTGNAASKAQLLSLLGNAYEALGDYASAIAAQQASLVQAEQAGAEPMTATALMNLGGLYALQGDYSQAIAQFEAGLAIARRLDDAAILAYGLSNLGAAYQQIGSPETVIPYYLESLSLAEATGNRTLQAEVLTNLGIAYESLGELERAIATHADSVAIARRLENPRLLAKALNNQAYTWLKADQPDPAEAALIESVNLLGRLRQGLSDSDKVAVFDTQIYTYNLLMQARVAQGNVAAALEASEQGRARAFAELVAGPEVTLPPPTLAHMQAVAQQLNATLVEYAIVPDDDFTVQGRQRGLAGELYTWVISPSGKLAFDHRDLSPVELSLEGLIQNSRTEIGALGRTRGIGVYPVEGAVLPKASLQMLHEVLIAPIAARLPTDPTVRIVFIPQESLFYVPFAALQDAAGHYLIEQHTLLTAPSIQLLELTLAPRDRPATDAPTALVAGNPVMPEVTLPPHPTPITLAPLPGAEEEAAVIAAIFHTEPILGAAATESALVPQMTSAQIIHLATHGLPDYVDSRDRLPTPGAIALAPDDHADGLLTAREIAQLNLRAALVVLSACDTGLGEVTGDGVVGLSRSLIAAGAQSTVVSLWAVPDAPTAELMVAFYENLVQGQDKAQALRQAMLATMATYPSPLAWAAFVLVGDPSPL
ncbi:MAG: CHAT domain-containing protein [Leptolyngbyaceae cyanobacterium T60_A2020_046]|nr:CHAT domain-containing protein [Leptolyngbyaceae cyanobacterium T60_A2020_046]